MQSTAPILDVPKAVAMGTWGEGQELCGSFMLSSQTDQVPYFWYLPPPGARQAWAGGGGGMEASAGNLLFMGTERSFLLFLKWSQILSNPHPREVAMAGLCETRSVLSDQRPYNPGYFWGVGGRSASAPGLTPSDDLPCASSGPHALYCPFFPLELLNNPGK